LGLGLGLGFEELLYFMLPYLMFRDTHNIRVRVRRDRDRIRAEKIG
jgi:hypothetical protein